MITCFSWKHLIIKSKEYNIQIIKFENILENGISYLLNNLEIYQNKEKNKYLWLETRMPHIEKKIHMNITKKPINKKMRYFYSVYRKQISIIEYLCYKELKEYGYFYEVESKKLTWFLKVIYFYYKLRIFLKIDKYG